MELHLDLNKQYTFADYLTWFDDTRREIIDGFIKLFPAPHDNHATVSYNIVKNIDISRNDLRFRYAPVDVLFYNPNDFQGNLLKKSEIKNVVQPDLFICKDEQMIDGCCHGAPLFIIEILSPSNRKNDTITKYNLYEKYGVQEYWICNPKTKSVVIYIMKDDKYDDGTDYIEGEIIKSELFGFEINTELIFKRLK